MPIKRRFLRSKSCRVAYLCRSNGVGKTHLAAAIGNFRKQLMEEPMFVVVPDFAGSFTATFSPVSTTTFDIEFEKVKNAQLQILIIWTQLVQPHGERKTISNCELSLSG